MCLSALLAEDPDAMHLIGVFDGPFAGLHVPVCVCVCVCVCVRMFLTQRIVFVDLAMDNLQICMCIVVRILLARDM